MRSSVSLLFCAAALLSLPLTGQDPPKRPAPPQQPLPYSHKTHLAAGLVCKGCHANRDPGESMGLPAASLCMGCHKTIAADKPAIKTLAEYAAANRNIPWARVYRIPSYVFFSHRAHLEAKATCDNCHGPVATRDALFRESDLSMGGCMDCHRRNKAPNDCNFCHEPR
jgi:hypothetical protein